MRVLFFGILKSVGPAWECESYFFKPSLISSRVTQQKISNEERESMSDKKVAPTTDYEDVDDVIGLAEELRMADSGRLSSEEIAEVGEDLGIEQKYIEQARDELVKRREVEAREAVASAAKAKTLRLGLSIGAVAFVVIFGVWAALASSSLGNREIGRAS